LGVQAVSAPQVSAQVPALQTSTVPQTRPQAPQFALSVIVFAQ